MALPALLALANCAYAAKPEAREWHQRLAPASAVQVALTLDACSGQVDMSLLNFLQQNKIPATLFVTQKWLKRNPAAIAFLKAHPELFEIENHGAQHQPAVIGTSRQVYGLTGLASVAELEQEVQLGAAAISAEFGRVPRFYRGATARYDDSAAERIQSLGYQIAGFSVNADQGASLGKRAILAKLARLSDGDIILAHLNKPRSATGAALITALPLAQQRGIQFVRLDAANLIRVCRRLIACANGSKSVAG